MKFKIYCDEHRNAMHACGNEIEYQEDQDYTIVHNGDNDDMTNCKRSEYDKAKRKQAEFIIKCTDTGTIRVDGNHDQISQGKGTWVYVCQKTKTLFTHGHWVCWLWDKVRAWFPEIKKSKGRKWYVWHSMRLRNLLKHRGTFKPKEWQLIKAYDLAIIHGCIRVVCGHTHTKKIVKVIYKGIEIYFLPKGITFLELPEV